MEEREPYGRPAGQLNELAKDIHDIAVSKGWYEQKRSPLEVHALIHSEISEATEEVRRGSPQVHYENAKPEGEFVELADALIRILDYLASEGANIDGIVRAKMAYNKTRPHRHGGKLF